MAAARSRQLRSEEGPPPSAGAPASTGPARALHYATVAVTGGEVMVVEVLGTRVIAPCYGVGLFVWTALLSVTLVCLAVGYRVGGKLADRRGAALLPPIIAAAALMTALVPLLRPTVLAYT